MKLLQRGKALRKRKLGQVAEEARKQAKAHGHRIEKVHLVWSVLQQRYYGYGECQHSKCAAGVRFFADEHGTELKGTALQTQCPLKDTIRTIRHDDKTG